MTELIVSFIRLITSFVNRWIPAITIDDGVVGNVVNAFSYFVNMVADINWLFPVDDALFIVKLLVGYKVAMFAVFAVNWVIRRIGYIIP